VDVFAMQDSLAPFAIRSFALEAATAQAMEPVSMEASVLARRDTSAPRATSLTKMKNVQTMVSFQLTVFV
jgi:hypothetical protein